ncbi:MAG: hypothetical protein EOP49_29950, partial [Sphingobacteriales bacterium]
MNKIRLSMLLIVLAASSCGDTEKKAGGPIVLGDSSMIVTETDPKNLTDFVDDIQFKQIEPALTDDLADTASSQVIDSSAVGTAAPQPAAPTPTPAAEPGDGLHVPFKEVEVFLPGIETKSYRNQNLQKANGATYQLTDGNIHSNHLRVTGATIQKVSQRYITTVVASGTQGKLMLDDLGTTSGWTNMPLKNGNYLITGLDQRRLSGKTATPAAIRNAVTRAAKNRRLSKAAIRTWEQSVR